MHILPGGFCSLNNMWVTMAKANPHANGEMLVYIKHHLIHTDSPSNSGDFQFRFEYSLWSWKSSKIVDWMAI